MSRYLAALIGLLFSFNVAAQVFDVQGLSASWYDPAVNGSGVFVDGYPSGRHDEVAAGWYVYDARGRQYWLLCTGRLIDGWGALTCITTLGEWGSAIDPAADIFPAGTVLLEFHDCASATWEYLIEVPGGGMQAGSLALQRLSPAPAGCR